jgi:uncharacterized membrane protein YgcG
MMFGKEPQSKAMRYAYGYSDEKPGLFFWILHIAMILFIGYTIISPAPAEEMNLPEKQYMTRVNDYMGLLSKGDVRLLNQEYARLEGSHKIALVVALVPDIKDYSIDEYTNALFAKWGVGSKKEDNGVLCVLAMKQQKLRCETGYGSEGILPDLALFRVIHEKQNGKSMLDALVQRNYYQALSLLGKGVAKHALVERVNP